jgi:hypothetical protein
MRCHRTGENFCIFKLKISRFLQCSAILCGFLALDRGDGGTNMVVDRGDLGGGTSYSEKLGGGVIPPSPCRENPVFAA